MKELEMAMGTTKIGNGGPEQPERAATGGRRGSAKQSAGRLQPVDHESASDLGMGLPMSSFTGMSNPKAAFDAISRRSTAMSNDGGTTEHGTPG